MIRPTLNPVQWSALSRQIAAYSGVALDASRLRSLENAVAARMEVQQIATLYQYLARLDQAELHALTELIVNHETQFFRTPAHYRALHEHVLPELQRRHTPGLPIRCWSAGCATGEEPYSIAITALNTLPTTRPIEVHATDLSGRALSRAREGKYRGRSLLNVAAADLERHFRHHADIFQIQPAVGSVVYFEQHNLQDAPPRWAQALDIIFCQNVTIYFALETCRTLIGRLYDALAPGGYLFLGYSETLWRIFDRFETVEIAGAFVYRKPRVQIVPRPAPVPIATPPRRIRPVPSVAPRRVTADSLLYDARQLVTAGKLDQALDLLHQVPPDQSQYPQALAMIAQVHANRGDWELATAEAKRAIDLDLLTGPAHLLLGTVCARQSQWDEALDHLLQAQYIEPSAPLPSFYLADVYRRQDRADLAEREYRITLRKLEALPPNQLLEGVSVGWLRETCSRYLEQLRGAPKRR